MSIPKHEYYEGAAMLGLIKRSGQLAIEYCPPFYRIGEHTSIYMKYCANPHTTWAFTFAAAERSALALESGSRRVVVCLICGGDGCVKLELAELDSLCVSHAESQRIGCTRRHGEHYEVAGPEGRLNRKIAPSEWNRVLEARGLNATH